MARYRVGDKVRVRTDLKTHSCYGIYKVRENGFCWGDEMFEPIPISGPDPEISPETERVIDDPVEHPAHYTSGEIECIVAIEASMSPEEFRGFLKGTAMKYMWRYDKKVKPSRTWKSHDGISIDFGQKLQQEKNYKKIREVENRRFFYERYSSNRTGKI